MILIERQPKYQPYDQAKLISMNMYEEILPFNQQQIREQARLTQSPLGKAFEKQIKPIEDQGKKQTKAIRDQEQVKRIKNILMMMKILH